MSSLIDRELQLAEDKFIASVTSRVRNRFAAARAAGEGEAIGAILADADAVADVMVAAIPLANPVDEIVGPFYDAPAVARWLGVSRQAVHKRIANRSMIACRLADGTPVLPAWQFTTEGAVRQPLLELWRLLTGAVDEWTAALWMRSPQENLDEHSAVDWLTANHEARTVLDAATADMRRWAE